MMNFVLVSRFLKGVSDNKKVGLKTSSPRDE